MSESSLKNQTEKQLLAGDKIGREKVVAIGVRIPCTPNKVSEFSEAGQRFSKLRALEARGGCV